MKKNIFLALALAVGMTACTGDYDDWADPQSTGAETPETVSLSVAQVAGIDLASVDSSLVQVFVPTLLATDGTTTKYVLQVSNQDGTQTQELTPDANGYVSKDELASIVETYYGRRPSERTLVAKLIAYVDKDGTTVKEVSENFNILATPEAPVIESAYYYVGAANGWNLGDKTYQLTNGGGDVYEDPVFTVTVPAPTNDDGTRADHWFAIAPQSALTNGDWSALLGTTSGNGCTDLTGSLAPRTQLADDGSICMPASDGAKYYTISINMMDYTYEITPLTFGQYIYYIGATDGWSQAEQRLESPNYDGVYTGYIYCADPNGWGNQFKFQKVAGDWGTEINSGNFTTFEGAVSDCGGNIGVTGGQSVYYFEVNLPAGTIKATEVTKMGIIGDFNGWGGDVEMTWNATDYCFEAQNAGVTTSGWKFRVNAGWDLNLGGTVDKLVGNGDNLYVAGNTVKLYPTRRNNDNIYCTVQ